MKYLLSIVIVCVTIFISRAGEPDAIRFKNDLKILRTALEQTHPNLYRFTSRNRFEMVFDSINQRITSNTNQLDFYRLVSRIESLVREGHTYLQPSEHLLQFIQRQRLFPFYVSLGNETITLAKSLDEQYKNYEGAEIRSVNGIMAADVIKQLVRSTGLKSGYNNAALFNILSFRNNFAFAYYCFVDTINTFLIEFKDGKHVAVKGSNISRGPAFPEFPKEIDPPVTLQLDSTTSTALITITTFAYWTVSFSMAQYVKTFSRYFNSMEKAGVENLIIDVRNNRGGEELLAAELLTYLVNNEFKIYKYIKASTLVFDYGLPMATKLTFSKNDYLKTDSGYFKIKDKVLDSFSPKKKNHFKGKIYILSNGGSRSATSTLLALMHTYQIGTIIGQESGGVYEDVDGRKRINLTLPYSGIQVNFPAWSFKINSRNGDRRRGVIPDFSIEPTKESILNKSDSVLAFTYDLIRKNNHKK